MWPTRVLGRLQRYIFGRGGWEEAADPVPVCDCGNDLRKGGKFYEGPGGGLSVNIQCATCGQWWNFAAYSGQVLQWDRLHKS